MDKIIKVIYSPWTYVVGLFLSLAALCGCVRDGAPGSGMLVCGICIGSYAVSILFSLMEGKNA